MKQVNETEIKEIPFRAVLKHERALRGWSQADVAERIGSDPKTVGRWERGLTFPSPYMCQQLSELYGKTVQELGLVRSANPPGSEETRASEIVVPPEEDSHLPEKEPMEALARFHWRNSAWRPWLVLCLLEAVSLLVVASLWSNLQTSSIVSRARVTLPDPYTGKGRLVLQNSLNTNTSARWSLGFSDEGGCFLSSGGYRVEAIKSGGYMKLCLADGTNFRDFTYEATMQVIAGTCGGLAFRGTFAWLYYFLICQDGRYRFVRYDRDNASNRLILISGISPVIHPGLNSTNVLAVVAQRSTFTLYINHTELYHGTDSAYLDGHIGLLAHPCNTTFADPRLNPCPVPVEVAFRDVRVWAL